MHSKHSAHTCWMTYIYIWGWMRALSIDNMCVPSSAHADSDHMFPREDRTVQSSSAVLPEHSPDARLPKARGSSTAWPLWEVSHFACLIICGLLSETCGMKWQLLHKEQSQAIAVQLWQMFRYFGHLIGTPTNMYGSSVLCSAPC